MKLMCAKKQSWEMVRVHLVLFVPEALWIPAL